MANELMRERPRDAADAEREDDVLDRRSVTGLDHARDQLLHLGGLDPAGRRPLEDVLRRQLGIAGPAGRVDQGNVEALDDLLVRKEQRRLHPELAAAGILRDRGLLRDGRGSLQTRGGSGLGRLGGHRRSLRRAPSGRGRAVQRVTPPCSCGDRASIDVSSAYATLSSRLMARPSAAYLSSSAGSRASRAFGRWLYSY